MQIGLAQIVSALVALLLLVGGAFSAGTKWEKAPAESAPVNDVEASTTELVAETENPAPDAPKYKVLRVTDGDTIAVEIEGKSQTVRLIGIDSPEMNDSREGVQCFAQEATARMKELLIGKHVQLEMDPTQGERDKYKRLLAFVFLDDLLVNLEMVRGGFAHEYTYDKPYKYQREFKRAEAEAREEGVGLWAPDACPPKVSTPTKRAPAPPKAVQKGVEQVVPMVQAAAAAAATQPVITTTSAQQVQPAASPLPVQSVMPPPPQPVVETPPPASPPAPAPTPSSGVICSANSYNCTDFATQKEAQSVYDQCGGLANDVHKLDKNKDGHPCDSLP